MSIFFSFLDILLILIMLFDTLGLIYLFRKQGISAVKKDEYIRVCFSWILFLTLYNIFSCNCAGFFGTLIRLIIFCAKAFVTIPLLGGTMKIRKYLIIDGKGKEYLDKVCGIIKSKLCKCNNYQVSNINSASEKVESETTEPETNQDNNISNQ